MHYIDLHCDTLMKCFFLDRKDFCVFPEAMVDANRLHQAGAMAQWFAVYLPPEIPCEDDEYIAACVRTFYHTVDVSPVLSSALNAEQVRENVAAGLVSGLLSMEDGRAINGSLEKLESFYQMGFRMIGLTWNGANCLGFPNSTDPVAMSLGLTAFGKDAVCRMEELGMLVDVSHLSDGGFYDVADVLRGPFIASHSNARSVSSHPRNLTDEMLRLLADRGGVAGLNFCPPFLETDNQLASTLDQMSRMISHMVRVAGIDTVAIGGDLDGIGGQEFDAAGGCLEVRTPLQMPLLYDRLQADGFSENQLDKIFYANALRVMSDCLK